MDMLSLLYIPSLRHDAYQLTYPLPHVAFFLTAHFSEEDYPYDWLMLWLSRRPEWQRSREFETTTRSSGIGADCTDSFGDEDLDDGAGNTATVGDDDVPGKVTTRVVFQPTFDTTHTIYYRGHWLRVRRSRKTDGSGTEILSIRYIRVIFLQLYYLAHLDNIVVS
jgi:chaperone BCS1